MIIVQTGGMDQHPCASRFLDWKQLDTDGGISFETQNYDCGDVDGAFGAGVDAEAEV